MIGCICRATEKRHRVTDTAMERGKANLDWRCLSEQKPVDEPPAQESRGKGSGTWRTG